MIDDATVARLLSPADTLAVVERAFTTSLVAPQRVAAEIDDDLGQTRTLLAMTALRPEGLATVKLVTVLQGPRAGLSSHLIAFDCRGELLAVIEAHQLTARRTAAASVFAARAMGAGQARHLAVLGAGRQARAQIDAYASAMPLEAITIWARRPEAAENLAQYGAGLGCAVLTASSPEDAVRDADLVTAVTPSETPILLGKYVASGAHVDLVGGFRPTMRESDDALIVRAAIVADTPAALVEAGDLVQPIARGVIDSGDVVFMSDFLAGKHPRGGDITLFKSVGHAAEDLVVTELLLERFGLTEATDTRHANTRSSTYGVVSDHV